MDRLRKKNHATCISSRNASRFVRLIYLLCMPTAKDASTQMGLNYTDINSLLDECNQSKLNELTLNEVIDDLRSKAQERKSDLLLLQVNNVKTRFYTRLPNFAVFMALFKFMEPYFAVAC